MTVITRVIGTVRAFNPKIAENNLENGLNIWRKNKLKAHLRAKKLKNWNCINKAQSIQFLSVVYPSN